MSCNNIDLQIKTGFDKVNKTEGAAAESQALR